MKAYILTVSLKYIFLLAAICQQVGAGLSLALNWNTLSIVWKPIQQQFISHLLLFPCTTSSAEFESPRMAISS